MTTDKESAEELRAQYRSVELTMCKLIERCENMQRMLNGHATLQPRDVRDLISVLALQVRQLACGVALISNGMALGFADWLGVEETDADGKRKLTLAVPAPDDDDGDPVRHVIGDDEWNDPQEGER